MRPLRLGTRGSQLALFQARTVARALHDASGIDPELVIIRTSGDRLADATLSEAGGKRLFVKEIEDALLAGEVDLAVHSSKDLPAELPAGLTVAAVLPREDPRDAVVLPAAAGGRVTMEQLTARLGPGTRVATSSVRRTAQLARLFPAASFVPIRGNLDTRLRKLDEGAHGDALVLAAAGLVRLDQSHRISAHLPADLCVPAPGQGIIAIEIRTDDAATRRSVEPLDDPAAATAFHAERAVVTALGGGCQMPLGAYATTRNGVVRLLATVLSLDGSRQLRAEVSGPVSEAGRVGRSAAEELLARGAGAILSEASGRQGREDGFES
jgi:hydroxymethylbilane synthase